MRRVALIIVLCALIVLVQVYQTTLTLDQRELFVLRWAAVPMEITERQDLAPTVPFSIAWTLISALFLHDGWAHVAGNLLLLTLFGAGVERELGWARTLAIYLLGGIAGGLAQLASNPASLVPLLGASGAVAALMGARLLLGRVTQLHALIFTAWAVMQAAAAVDTLIERGWLSGGVSVWSHLGGLAVGLSLTLLRKLKIEN